VTASHCSNNIFAQDDAPWNFFYQPVGGARIGYEVMDRGPFGGTVNYNGRSWWCAPNSCRFSDAQVSLYDDTVQSNQGWVSRPETFSIGGAGPVTISDAFPQWDIINKMPLEAMTAGMWVDKIGRTSGWTRGQISHTCVDESFNYPPPIGTIWFLCQWRAGYFRMGDDSGGPVLFISNQDPAIITSVHLLGIHVGGSAPNQGIFSPVLNIEKDFQLTLKVCNWANSC
jgi:hypothetical protein